MNACKHCIRHFNALVLYSISYLLLLLLLLLLFLLLLLVLLLLIIPLLLFSSSFSSSSHSSSSSIGATTLGGWWPDLQFCSTIFYLYTSLSNFALSSSLNLLLPVWAISVLVFLLVFMNMVPIQLVFLTILIVSILITCAAQRNLCDFINLTTASFLIRIPNFICLCQMVYLLSQTNSRV